MVPDDKQYDLLAVEFHQILIRAANEMRDAMNRENLTRILTETAEMLLRSVGRPYDQAQISDLNFRVSIDGQYIWESRGA